jgi:cardiolipin synthase
MSTLAHLVWFYADLSLAVFATLSIILHKRQPHSAMLWIILVWTLPFLGFLIYWNFGSTRVLTRKRRQPLLIQPMRAGNRVDLLEDGANAYPAMLESVAKARHSVDLITYIFDMDSVGLLFVEALSAASARGVRVRVLVDGIGAWAPGYRLKKQLGAAGVEFATFWRKDRIFHQPVINLRNHRKLLVVDEKVAYSGGLNISERHHKGPLAGHPLRRFRPIKGVQRDLHFRFRGPVVADMQGCFDQDWSQAKLLVARPARRPGSLTQGPRPPSAGRDKSRVLISGPDENYERIYEQLLCGLRLAKKSVDLCTPYFIPDEVLLSSLRVLGLSGVRVRLFLPRKNDHFYMSWASRACYWDLLEAGVEIWEIQGSFVHSKAVVVDGQWCLVGSCNLDPRSFRLNFELNVEVASRRLALQIRRALEHYLISSRKVELDHLRREPYLARLRDHVAKLFSPIL